MEQLIALLILALCLVAGRMYHVYWTPRLLSAALCLILGTFLLMLALERPLWELFDFLGLALPAFALGSIFGFLWHGLSRPALPPLAKTSH